MNASRHYEHGYHSAVHGNLLGSEPYYRAVAHASQAMYLSSADRTHRVLDYGCGLGQLIHGLPNAAGFEVSSEARSHCVRLGIRVWGSLEEVPEGAWDLIVFRHVLEHLESPLEALRGVQKLLAPHGEVLIVLPREGHQDSPLTPDIHQHLYCWNFRSLNNLLHRAGLQPITNQLSYVRGFGAFLPLYKLGAHRLYRHALHLAGRMVGNAELVVRARVGPEQEQ